MRLQCERPYITPKDTFLLSYLLDDELSFAYPFPHIITPATIDCPSVYLLNRIGGRKEVFLESFSSIRESREVCAVKDFQGLRSSKEPLESSVKIENLATVASGQVDIT
jgi:hypothetical protein